jgi:hypothetical protein
VEPTPLEQQIGDLDVAIDRLRSLYDQYFMGIERIEPAVPRKDVERKIYALRKEQIRNTALRFRFQMILQRYSTFQSHWQRICREIENGTYKRQLRHSERKRAPAAEALPVLVAAPEVEAPPPTEASPGTASPQLGAALSVPAGPPLRAPLPAPAAPPPRAPFPAPGAPPPRDLAAELEELDKEFAPATPRGIGPPGPPPRIPAIPTRDGQPVAPRQPLPAPVLSRPPPLSPPARAVTPGLSQATAPGHSQAAAPGPGKPAIPAPGQPAAPPPSRPAIPIPPARTARVPPAPPSAPAKSIPAAANAPPRRDGGLPEYRVRQLYVEYVDAKRRQKESTASLTYEALAESLRASSQKLREKHGKPVDFEVGLKDGKAVLRPKLK